ncbi:lipopolysaccharide assembly protein LapB [Caloramator sp. ALD01]|uniref:tetratricopeptide repeat protein n=1 Tax=Caloramator sp. ALD01 TaxID=1031288 RepID=UPI0018DAF9F7|nr:hypothetical protein [Caloramator sp. ALD01]
MSITCVILGVCNLEEELIDQLKFISKDIIYVPIVIKGTKRSDIKISNINFDGNLSKLKNMVLSQVTGEYVLFIMSNERISDIEYIKKLKLEHDAYSFNVIQNRAEGIVVEKQIRLHKRNITYIGHNGKSVASFDLEALDIFINTKTSKEENINIYKALNKYTDNLSNYDFVVYIMELYYLSCEFDEVIKLYNVIHHMGVDEYTKRLVGLSYFYKNRYIEAKMFFEELKQKKYGDSSYFSGLINKRLGNYNEAIEDFFSCLKSKDFDISVWGCNSFLCYYELGEVYYFLEDYSTSLKYYSYAYMAKKEYIFLNKMFRIFKVLKFKINVIEGYLKDNLNIQGRDLYINMMRGLRDTARWEEVIKYSIFEDDLESVESRIIAYYHIGEFSRCFDLIYTYFKYLDKEFFLTLGICCILLDSNLYLTKFKDFVEIIKRENLSELIDAHNYFYFNTEYKGNTIYLEAIIKLLLRSRNSKVEGYVKRLISDKIDIKFYDVLKSCYENKYYDLCLQIIDDKYRDYKFDFNVLTINAKICFLKGNYSDCEKYISYALMLKDSEELNRLLCMCRIKTSVLNILKSKDLSVKTSCSRAVDYLELAYNNLDIFKDE